MPFFVSERSWRLLGVTLATMLLGACTSLPTPERRPDQVFRPDGTASRGSHVFNLAKNYVGTPYVFGGDTPHGFDCSGLVFFAYQQLGINVPRTAADQYRQARPVRLDRLVPGDLVFFRLERNHVGHVGIYAGDSQFIHAPRPGSKVTYDRLDSPFWRRRLVGAGGFM